MDGKLYRLREFIRVEDKHSLIVDASGGLSLGTLPGLEDFGMATRSVLGIVDGLVCSPGQFRRIPDRTRGEASLLVRMDWTNTLRGSDFVLPPTNVHHLPLLTVQDALDLGATAMVSSFLLGYEEEVEAGCLRNTVQWAMDGNALGLPLIVEVRTTGPRVSIRDKAIELGASYALEGGADAIVLPYPGRKSLESIAAFVSVPWLIKPSHFHQKMGIVSFENAAPELEEAIGLGGAGLWLDHSVFALSNTSVVLQEFALRLHQAMAVA
jgi:DhnA family fructose-bisphosphate aldolase class Ia